MTGLTENGLEIKRFTEVQESVNENLKSRFGETLNTDEDSVVSQIRDTLALELSDLWELSQAVYDSQSPSRAEGQQLDDNVEIVGVERLDPRKSTVSVSFTGDNNTSVPLNTVMEVNTSKSQFQTLAAKNIDATSANSVTVSVDVVADSTVYTVTVGATPYSINSGVSATNLTIAADLVAAFTGNSQGLLATDNTDGTFIISGTEPLTEFNYSITVNLSFTSVTSIFDSESVEFGSIQAPEGQLVNLISSVSGVTSITNPLSATLGSLEETDTQLRIRRNLSLSGQNCGSLDSIVRKVRDEVPDVTYVLGRENTTLVVDGNGLPAKSFEIIVEGGTDDTIAQGIWDTKPAGIESHSATADSGTAIDASENEQTVPFSRTVQVPIYVDAEYSLYSEEVFPANGEDLIKQAVLEFGQSLAVDEDVISQRFHGPIYLAVEGIGNLTIKISTSPSPTLTTTIAISNSERSSFIDANVAVTFVP